MVPPPLLLLSLLAASCPRASSLFSKRFRVFPAPLSAGPSERWFRQRLDHFNGAEGRVWEQQYFINDTFYKTGGPVFLMIGGEGPANPAWMHHGTWLTYAEKLGALCLLLEHRFYGKSHPTQDLSTSNLHYLSSRQALADLAHFRTVMAEKLGLVDNKWVAFGGSYPGSLAAWFRLKYPHLVDVAVATSAPIYAVMNFPEYLEVVQKSLRTFRRECPEIVREASDTVVEMLKYKANYFKITKDFNLCEQLQIKSKMDSAYFLESLASNFMDVVQYNEDNRAFEGVKGTNITINVLCDIMSDISLGTPYDRYATVVRLLLNTFEMTCLDASYSNYVQEMTNFSWDGPAATGGRQWVYQTCTEFGFFQSTDSKKQPFSGFPLHYHLQQCSDIYGQEFNSTLIANAIRDTNENYGGFNITGSRIVFPNGSIDPWSALGVISDISKDLPAAFIKGTAHCAIMYPERTEDSAELVNARVRVFRLLQKWLKQ
ncbi:thymus-specific serine protease [Ornithorhynchus anatinus]|uniref:Serine protease 16 n=1 Tax=Ornithorhynchus anatinus TaxID=9258 RepID=F7DQB7_ORNAN|nr:thymus-specific serine protease [Ornithorhynchus anatinus]